MRNTFCKTCYWKRSCGTCKLSRRGADEFVAGFSLSSLVVVPYRQWRELPATSAIYFALASDRSVIYIGQTQDLLHRWRTNYRALFYCGIESIGYVLAPSNGIWRLRAEHQLIKIYRPLMNGVRKMMGPKRGPKAWRASEF